jgi:Tol biopolymer transport system component
VLIDLVGKVTQLPRPGGIVNTYAPAFSPDGSSIVFSGTTEPGAAFDIYTMGPDGSDLVEITDTPNAKEVFADWGP